MMNFNWFVKCFCVLAHTVLKWVEVFYLNGPRLIPKSHNRRTKKKKQSVRLRRLKRKKKQR